MTSARAKHLDFDEKHKTSYCIPLWLRDEQVRLAIKKIPGRIEKYEGLRSEPIAVVGFGPSLNETWEKIRGFKYIISTSGAHRFLVERGIVPTWHASVDPRDHQIALLGAPHPDVTYLPASTCHPKYLDMLAGYKVLLWHVFASEEDAYRTLPQGEWALTGGPDVGMRAMALARFFGFTEQHVFGIDGCAGPADSSHAAAHPFSPGKYLDCEFPKGSGRVWRTTPALLECAKSMRHELGALPDVRPVFYGDTLVKAIVESRPIDYKEGAVLGVSKLSLISPEYAEMNRKLHAENLAYGVGGGKHAPTVLQLVEKLGSKSVLDYGCGKGYLAKALPFPIWEYDPAVEGKTESPRPADLVVCTDVLEHIELDMLVPVVADLARCTRTIGYFVIHTGPSRKLLPDGRNAHLIQQPKEWWSEVLSLHFNIARIIETGPLLHFVVSPRKGVPSPKTKFKLKSDDGKGAASGGNNTHVEPHALTLYGHCGDEVGTEGLVVPRDTAYRHPEMEIPVV